MRAIVQVDHICPPDWVRSLLVFIDVEGGKRTQICNSNDDGSVAAGGDIISTLLPTWKNITVEASAPGFEAQRLSIPVSVDSSTDSVLATAARSIKVANLGDEYTVHE